MEQKLLEGEEKRNSKQVKHSSKKVKDNVKPQSSDFIVKLFEQAEYYLKVTLTGKQYKYTLLNNDEVIDEHNTDKKPSECNKDTKFIKGFAEQLEGEIKTEKGKLKYPVSKIAQGIMLQTRKLQKQLDAYEENKEEIISQELEEKQKQKLKEVTVNYEKLNTLLNEAGVSIIDYIQICSTYLSNGENKNILIGMLCYLSTYLKREALWFMVVGPSGEGKSFIQSACMKLMPSDAFEDGKKTEASLHRATLENGENYIDGKIMMLGDLGGKNDFQKYEGILDKYKELSTDGEVIVEVVSDNVNEEYGERGARKYTVKGYCSACFSTIHTEDIDEQYQNRGRLVEPESTNDHVRKYQLYNKGKYETHVKEVINKYINHYLHDYIEYLHLKCMNVQVFNPFLTCLHDWLEEDEYFKRSIGQYEKLVETVTVVNYPNREIISNSDGDKFIVSTAEDNELITRLFIPSFGLSPVAIRLFNKIIDWFFKSVTLDKFGERDGVNSECTVEEYIQSANDELSDYQNGNYKINDFVSLFTNGSVNRKAKNTTTLNGVDVGGIIGNLMHKGYIVSTDVKVKGGGNKNVYRLNYFKHIENRRIEFSEDCVNSYLHDVVPVTYGDIEYTHSTPPVEMKNILDEDKLRECSVDGLGVAKWF